LRETALSQHEGKVWLRKPLSVICTSVIV